jgi:hypothetical protein
VFGDQEGLESLLGICFWRKASETAVGQDRRAGKKGLVDGADKVTFKLNGEVVHEIQDLEMKVDGKWLPLDKGRIALQAEWAELLYRNVRIKEL